MTGHFVLLHKCTGCRDVRIVLLCLICLPALLFAQDFESQQQFHFRKLGIAAGLDVEVVSSVLVDRRGLLWIGSREGLFTYDGIRLKHFTPQIRDHNSLSDLDIRKLYQSPDGAIWIATNTGGLNRFDPNSQVFQRYQHDSDTPHSLSDDSVYDMLMGEDNTLWVATQQGLNQLNVRTAQFRRFVHSSTRADSLAHNYIYSMTRDRQGRLWLGTLGGGLSMKPENNDSFVNPDLAGQSGEDGYRYIYAVLTAEDGGLWLGTRSGLIHYQPSSRVITPINLTHTASDKQPLVTSLLKDQQGNLLVGTMTRGVLRYRPKENQWQVLNDAPLGNGDHSPQVPILSMAQSQELLFVGTWGGGLYLTRLLSHPFRLYGSPGAAPVFRNINVTALKSYGAKLLVGTFGGGVQMLEPNTGELSDPLPEQTHNTGVMAIAETPSGQLYLADNAGLTAIDMGSSRYRRWIYDEDVKNGLGQGYVTSLVVDEKGIWVGTGGSGLYWKEDESDDFTAFLHRAEDPSTLSGDYVTDLEILDDALWVATRSNGLNRCLLPAMRCQRFNTETAGRLRLDTDQITSLFTDDTGQLWFTTSQSGVYRLNRDIQGNPLGYLHIGKEQGLLWDSLTAMAQDTDGSYWLASREGLSRISADFSKVMNYGLHNGLPVTHFNAKAVARDPQYLYFGTPKGLLAISRSSPFVQRPPSPMILSDVITLNVNHRLSAADYSEQLSLEYGDNFSVEFAVLDYAEVPHDYQYRLDKEGGWQTLEQRNQLTFINLAPGHYSLQIRGQDVFGMWSTPIELQIQIAPAWWQRLDIQLLLLALTAGLLFNWYRRQLNRLSRHNCELIELQQQREQALKQAQHHRNELRDAYNGLRHLTDRLETAKETERLHISRELHDELGQTLTAAKLNLQQSMTEAIPPEATRRVRDTLELLSGMIRQVRSVSLRLRPPLLDHVGLVPAVEEYLQGVRERTEIQIALIVEGHPKPSRRLRLVVFRVIQEAMNNVIKHAGASEVSVRLRQDKRLLMLQVIDNGCGFDQQAVEKRIHRGEHLGLLGIVERVKRAGGEVSLQATPGQGCKIEVRIHDDETDKASSAG